MIKYRNLHLLHKLMWIIILYPPVLLLTVFVTVLYHAIKPGETENFDVGRLLILLAYIFQENLTLNTTGNLWIISLIAYNRLKTIKENLLEAKYYPQSASDIIS